MTATTHSIATSQPESTSRRRAAMRRPGRGTSVLLAAIAIAGASYLAGPLLAPAPVPALRPALPFPGDVAPSAGQGAAGATADGRLPIAGRIAFWSGRVATNPEDFLSLVQLALVEAERARLTVDLDGYQRALGEIDRSLAIVPAYPPTIRARGSIRFALHDFTGALADAEAVLAVAPRDTTAIALRGDALLELGRPDAAATDYERLATTSPGPWLDVRRARLASVTGDPDRALSLARKALAAASTVDPTEIGFYAYAVGEYARLAGDPLAARSGYDQALEDRPTDVAALVGRARIDAFEGRKDEAIAGLQRAAEIVPQPETLALLGDLQAAGGDATAAEATFRTVRFIRRLGAIQGAVYDRQLLRFELDHGGATADLLDAVQASATDRPDASGHDLVAWALYRLGRFEEAAAEIDTARVTGADDDRLRFHDGAIAIARGELERGRQLVSSALDDGPALDPIERAEALRLMNAGPARR